MKQKLLLIGYRAYGDWAYTAPVLPLLFEKYDVVADINYKGAELLLGDPRFKDMTIFQFEKIHPDRLQEAFELRKADMIRFHKPDVVIDLSGTLEVECIPERFQPEFHLPVAERQKLYAKKNFYEAVFKRCNLEMPAEPNLEGFHFDPRLVEVVERWRKSHEGQFVIMMPVAGSRYHKLYLDAKELTYAVLEKYKDAVVYLVTEPDLKNLLWKHERIWHCYEAPIKQVFLMTKYADYCVGPETGVMVAAGMWGTPKTMLCTASSVEQTTKYQKNDFSIQAMVPCSPCHRAIHFDIDCEKMIYDENKVPHHAACTQSVPKERILQVIDHVYRNLRRGVSQAV